MSQLRNYWSNLQPGTQRRARISAAALVVATAAFWAVILTAPPLTEAEEAPVGLNISDLLKDAPNLPVGPTHDPI